MRRPVGVNLILIACFLVFSAESLPHLISDLWFHAAVERAPGRVHPRLQRYPAARYGRKRCLQCFGRRRHLVLQQPQSRLIQDAGVAGTIS